MRMKKACRTCHARRIWCDATLPSCEKCVTSGRQCGGYEKQSHVFVNFDSANISVPKKKVRGQAIKKANFTKQISIDTAYIYPSQTIDLFQDGREIRAIAIDLLDVTAAEFRGHLTTLWEYFRSNYESTIDSLTHGLDHFGMQNKALDLGLIALSTQRLALSANDPKLQVMSSTAYHHSLRIFQKLLQYKSTQALAVLFVVSFVYTLIEGARSTPVRIYAGGSEGHLRGALALLEKHDPELFSNEGYHRVFTKIRELGFHYLMSAREKTFLSDEKWMTLPWKRCKKNWRDKLQDIGVKMTDVVAYAYGPGLDSALETSEAEQRRSDTIKDCRYLKLDLIGWRQNWLRTAYPSVTVSCNGLCKGSCHCSCMPSEYPSSDFALLQAEYWSLSLMLGMLHRDLQIGLVHRSSEQSDISSVDEELMDVLFPDQELPYVAALIEKAFVHPYFGQVLNDSPGIMEGRCRSLFPLWVLNQYRSSTPPTPETEGAWWSQLGTRLNFGDPAYSSPYV